MSENITHIAVSDDCFRLASASAKICEPFKQAIASHGDFARLGSVTRHGDRFNPVLLERFRDCWEQRTPEQNLEPKLAFVLAWLCHRAADRVMKPVFRTLEPNRTQSPSDCSIYHDAFVLKEVFGGGDSSYNPLAAGANSDLRSVARSVFQAVLVELHTLTPESGCVEGWIAKLFEQYTKFHVNIDRYRAAVATPDPVKQKRYVEQARFYDPHEPLIATARRIQRGETVELEAVREACSSEPRSLYATALSTAYGYIEGASGFFTGTLSREALESALNIDEPGVDGKPV